MKSKRKEKGKFKSNCCEYRLKVSTMNAIER